jgi:hypothetical protein
VVDIEEPRGTVAEPVFRHCSRRIPERHIKPRKGDELGSRGLMPRYNKVIFPILFPAHCLTDPLVMPETM